MRNLKHEIGRIIIPLLPVNRRTFDILRYELHCIWLRLSNALNPQYRLRIRKFRQTPELSLNIGSGSFGLKDWVNIDSHTRHPSITLAMDVRRGLPFRDNQVRRIFSEHAIEHLDFRQDVPALFKEFYRVLVPGGVLRIIVPHGGRFLKAYASGSKDSFAQLGWDLDALPDDIYTPMHIVNHIFHQSGEHLFAWDFETMELMLKRAGFSEITQREFRQSADPGLAIDQQIHKPYSLIVEATKASPP
jgi:predicted SAM-dependent methyltransferase